MCLLLVVCKAPSISAARPHSSCYDIILLRRLIVELPPRPFFILYHIIPTMNSFLARSAAIRRAPFILRQHQPGFHPSLKSKALLQRPSILQARFAANSVSGRPGSQTIAHAAQNVKEEVGNSAADWAKHIAGGNFTQDAIKTEDPTFVIFRLFF